jgi:MYXO-CTERM domain-containing protein
MTVIRTLSAQLVAILLVVSGPAQAAILAPDNDCDEDCDDGNPCTDDSCVQATGECLHVFNGAGCDDGDLCTVLDKCLNGMCQGKPLSCDDGHNCTQDFCQPDVGCIHNGQDDMCDDGNPCTADSCSAVSGCQNTPADVACSDGNLCTSGDQCVAGVCVSGAQKECDDNNVCTQDWCEEETGNCIYLGQPGNCDDGDVCTGNDACQDGACVGELLSDCCATDDECVNPTPECLTVSCVGNQCKFEAYCVEGQCGPSPCDESLDCGGCLPFQVCISNWCEEECDLADKDLTQCVSDDTVLEKCLEDPDSGNFYWKQTDCISLGEPTCAYSQDKGLFDCCTPDCTGKACGMPSDCGVSCGTCQDGEFCCLSGEECANGDAANAFQCLDCCFGLDCGQGQSDQCSGTNCGSCDEGMTCKEGSCVSSCDDECADSGWECGHNTCGEPCGDYGGECAPGFNCVPDTHQCLCQMPDLRYPDVEEPGPDATPDAGPSITIPIEEDDGDVGGKKSGGCSNSSTPNGAATLLALLLMLFALIGLTRRPATRV